MIPIHQTSFYDPDDETRGNCIHACVASIFHLGFDSLKLAALPDIVYGQDLIKWTKQFHLGWDCINRDFRTNYQVRRYVCDEFPEGLWKYDDPETWHPPHMGYWIGTVYSSRIKRPKDDPYWPRPGLHAIVMKGFKKVFDPHPQGNLDDYEKILGSIHWVVSDPFLAT